MLVAALIAPWNFPIGMPARKARFLPFPVGKRSLLTVHEPLGAAALIAPWNFPIGMPARKVRFLTSPVGEECLLTVHEPLGVAAILLLPELPPLACQPER
jgi:hypothetical protein